ncbi:MAG: HAMP domain-containing protein [Dehalococcoidia bacterium]|nr:HAMP domain-containing protein [Dehalococcoidia bacterium]
MNERLRRLFESRFRIATQLYVGIGGAVVLTVGASLVAWFSFNIVGQAQSQVNEESLPEMEAAFGVAQHSGTLVDAAPRLMAATNIEDLAKVSRSVDDAREDLEANLDILLGSESVGDSDQSGNIPVLKDVLAQGEGEGQDIEVGRSARIRESVDMLIVNINAIRDDMTGLYELNKRRDDLRRDLEQLRENMDEIMVPVVDDQLFYTMTGYQSLDAPPVSREQHFSEDQLARYRNLAGLHADATTANQLLESAFSISSAPLLEPLRERFESAKGSIERNITALEGSPLQDEITPLATQLLELGTGNNNGFDLLEDRLQLIQNQQDLLELNSGIAIELVSDVNSLVDTASENADQAAQASTQAIFTGRTLLLAISAVGVTGAILISWLFVGRVIVRRIQQLSAWMLQMAGGDLEAQVDLGGRDEVADMADALEVFRRHALEVQRLNLVEQLAEELQGKNDQLESVLADLRRAQEQIVMREKLAALGELTAGVAHEIKNPLNFVKNFSESSNELLDELKEVLDENVDKISEEDQSYIKEISDDLNGNLNRIISHGERANRIVQDMLMMGRETGEERPTDINVLLDEHARLAYHSARATDPNFQLHIVQELGPDVGEIVVKPQDVGRVFLNIVGNACDATDEKRRALHESGDTSYMPTLSLSTSRGEEFIEVRIRDNGDGIPPDVAEKIFNPFFTTKPTDRGTGLGLAITNDIVRQHGGSIEVNSEPGKFTEMTVRLPIEPTQVVGGSQGEELPVG